MPFAGVVDKKITASGKEKKGKKEEDDLSNLFECLELKEPSENPLGHVGVPGVRPKDLDVEDFADDAEDEAFALWCYLEDANETRKFVRQLWAEYRSGDLSLATAGTLTEWATGMLRRAHDEFVRSHASFNDWKSVTAYLRLKLAINRNVVYVFPSEHDGAANLPPMGAPVADLLCSSAAPQIQAYMGASNNFALSFTPTRQGLYEASVGDVRSHRPMTALEGPLFSMVRELTRLTYLFIPGIGSLDYKGSAITDRLLGVTCGFADPMPLNAPMWLVFGIAMCVDIAEIVESSPTCPSDAVLESAACIEAIVQGRFQFERDLDEMEKGTLPTPPEDRVQFERVSELASITQTAIKQGRRLDDPAQYQRMSYEEKLKAHMAKRRLLAVN